MPINAALSKGKKTHLVIKIPKGYKFLQDDLRAEMLEFIPENDEDPYKWSEIITTYSLVGHRIKAKQCVQITTDCVKRSSIINKIFNPSSEDLQKYSTSSVTISYKNNGRKELVYMKYFSGPFDCSGFQYAIAITDQMTEDDALEKIKKFEEEETSIIFF